MTKGFITVKRASEILSCTPHYVRKLIKDQKILGHQIENSNRWEIDRASIENYRKTDIFKEDLTAMRKPQELTIKDAVENVEIAFDGDVITYIMDPNQGSIIESNDALQLNNLLSSMRPHYKGSSSSGKKFKKIILILHSGGGFLEAAVKLVGIIRTYSEEFEVIVPLMAKSAATIIALKADKLYLFPVSELGPVDPVVQSSYNPSLRVPAHSIKQFINQYHSQEKTPFIDLLKGMNDPFILCTYDSAQIFAKSELMKCLQKNDLDADQITKAEEIFLKRESHFYPILFDELKELGIGQIIKSDVQRSSVNLLMSIFINFMSSHNIIKVIGNREENNNVVLPPNLVKQKSIQTGN